MPPLPSLISSSLRRIGAFAVSLALLLQLSPFGMLPVVAYANECLEGDPITQIVFTTNPQTIDVNTASAVLTVQTQDSGGCPEQVSGQTTLNLVSDSGTGQFSNANGSVCTGVWSDTPSTLTMSNGTANKNFCYRDSTTGTHTLTVSAESESWAPAIQAIVVECENGCEDPWPNHKMHYPQLPDPYGWDVYANFEENRILADDFMCAETGLITDLHFWGSWFGDMVPFEPAVGAPFGFHISFHADIPDPDGPEPGYSMPGQLLWERDIFYPDFSVEEMPTSPQGWFEPPCYFDPIGNHMRYFRYDIFFDELFDEEELFIQEEGTIYWVDIAPIYGPPCPNGPPPNGPPYFSWGWKTSMSEHFNDDAVWGVFDEPGGWFWNELRDPMTRVA